jgi:hypothetical protein
VAVSTNLKYMRGSKALEKKMLQVLGAQFGPRAFTKKVCFKNNGVPGATDTPVQKGDLCLRTDVTPNTLWVNTTYDAGSASNVWTQIA